MRLIEQLKEKIDNYFEQVSAEELYRISIEKYEFTENTSFELVDEMFKVGTVDKYSADGDTGFFQASGENSYNYAA